MFHSPLLCGFALLLLSIEQAYLLLILPWSWGDALEVCVRIPRTLVKAVSPVPVLRGTVSHFQKGDSPESSWASKLGIHHGKKESDPVRCKDT